MNRFTMRYGKYIDNEENIEYDEKWDSWRICDLLNKYHEECKMYREDALKAEKDKEELLEDNEKLKEFIEQLQEELVLFKKAGADMGNDLNAQITALKQENEQLKVRLKEFEE